jgi:2-polyprenyl-6-methoxyphenol hydroxylase-like FAD-dependent oxidoreductase
VGAATPDRRRVLIVGGGITGLALAPMLKRIGQEEIFIVAGRERGAGRRCFRRYFAPAPDTETSTPRPGAR